LFHAQASHADEAMDNKMVELKGIEPSTS